MPPNSWIYQLNPRRKDVQGLETDRLFGRERAVLWGGGHVQWGAETSILQPPSLLPMGCVKIVDREIPPHPQSLLQKHQLPFLLLGAQARSQKKSDGGAKIFVGELN